MSSVTLLDGSDSHLIAISSEASVVVPFGWWPEGNTFQCNWTIDRIAFASNVFHTVTGAARYPGCSAVVSARIIGLGM